MGDDLDARAQAALGSPGVLNSSGKERSTLSPVCSWYLHWGRDRSLACRHRPERADMKLAKLVGRLALFTGWLGGDLADRLAVGAGEGDHIDSPGRLRLWRMWASIWP